MQGLPTNRLSRSGSSADSDGAEMELNTRGRYAVMALADLARHGGSEALPLAVIAERQQISVAYLEQLFQKLRKSGLVDSARGRSGGYRLARGAEAITIAEIMSAVEEPWEMTRCRTTGEAGCVGHSRCLTHDLWDALSDHIQSFLQRATLADIISGAFARPRPEVAAE